MKEGLTVGGVASAAGVTPDAVRYYEKLSLLSSAPLTTPGTSLAEIGSLFPQSRLGLSECRRVRATLGEKIGRHT